MANCKECDRCKKIYKTKINMWEVWLNDFASPLKTTNLIKRENALQFLTTILDLCPDCEKELKKWLKRSDNNAE